MATIEELIAAFTLEPTGTDSYRASNVPAAHGVVFGGQLLGQAILAGQFGHDDKTVKTVHTVFARGGKPDLPLDIVVEPMQSGRTFASSTVTISQGDRLCTRSIVLLHADEGDVIRHADTPTRPSSPDDAQSMGEGTGAWQIRVVDGVDISDPDAVGPAELDVWTRFEGAPQDASISQALLAFATDGFLIGTPYAPAPGVGQTLAHLTLATGVVSHTLTFHEPAPAGDWMLLSQRSPYAGRVAATGGAMSSAPTASCRGRSCRTR